MIDHSSCDHPRTSKDRAACRKAMAKGSTHDTAAGTASPRPPAAPSPYKSLADANAQGAIDTKTLDDRIRDSKRRPQGSSVYTTRHTDGCGALDTLRSSDCTCGEPSGPHTLADHVR